MTTGDKVTTASQIRPTVVAATRLKNSVRRRASGRSNPMSAATLTPDVSSIPFPGAFRAGPGYSQGAGLKSNRPNGDRDVATQTAQALWYVAAGQAELR